MASQPFSSTRGVRQGCLLSPLLFNWVFDRVLCTAQPHLHGVCLQSAGREPLWLKLRAYADDVVLYSPDRSRAVEDFRTFQAICRKADLKVSIAKTKVLTMPDRRVPAKPKPTIAPPLRTVLSEAVNAGAVYYVMPDDRTQRRACPVTGCSFVANAASSTKIATNHIRAHLQMSRNISVGVLTKEPVAKQQWEWLPHPEFPLGGTCAYCNTLCRDRRNYARHLRTCRRRLQSLGTVWMRVGLHRHSFRN